MSDYLSTQWLPREEIEPNDWNPNEMETQTRDQLTTSILDNGWTRPILIHAEEHYIIDGEQRWTVAGRDVIESDGDLTPPDVPAGYVPVFGVTVDESQAKLSTVQHNHATGSQEADRLRDFIDTLEDDNLLETALAKAGFNPAEKDLTVVEEIPDEEREDEEVFVTGDDRSLAARQAEETSVIEFAMTAEEFDSVFTSTDGTADRIVSDIVALVQRGELAEVLDYTEKEAAAIEEEVERLLEAHPEDVSA